VRNTVEQAMRDMELLAQFARTANSSAVG